MGRVWEHKTLPLGLQRCTPHHRESKKAKKSAKSTPKPNTGTHLTLLPDPPPTHTPYSHPPTHLIASHTHTSTPEPHTNHHSHHTRALPHHHTTDFPLLRASPSNTHKPPTPATHLLSHREPPQICHIQHTRALPTHHTTDFPIPRAPPQTHTSHHLQPPTFY